MHPARGEQARHRQEDQRAHPIRDAPEDHVKERESRPHQPRCPDHPREDSAPPGVELHGAGHCPGGPEPGREDREEPQRDEGVHPVGIALAQAARHHRDAERAERCDGGRRARHPDTHRPREGIQLGDEHNEPREGGERARGPEVDRSLREQGEIALVKGGDQRQHHRGPPQPEARQERRTGDQHRRVGLGDQRDGADLGAHRALLGVAARDQREAAEHEQRADEVERVVLDEPAVQEPSSRRVVRSRFPGFIRGVAVAGVVGDRAFNGHSFSTSPELRAARAQALVRSEHRSMAAR